MNWRSIWAIALKDLKRRCGRIKLRGSPAVVMPVIFAIVFPLIFSVLPQVMPVDDLEQEMGDMQVLLNNLPAAVQVMFNG